MLPPLNITAVFFPASLSLSFRAAASAADDQEVVRGRWLGGVSATLAADPWRAGVDVLRELHRADVLPRAMTEMDDFVDWRPPGSPASPSHWLAKRSGWRA